MSAKMTPGERAVWAAEFVRMMGAYLPSAGRAVDDAARRATELVYALRTAAALGSGAKDTVAALDDMTGGK